MMDYLLLRGISLPEGDLVPAIVQVDEDEDVGLGN
jgi:hypothetical protein